MARKKKDSLGHSRIAPVEIAPYGDADESPKSEGKRGVTCHSTPESNIQVCVRKPKQRGERMSGMPDVCRRLTTMGQADREHFVALHLDVKHRVIAQERIAMGSATGVEISIRETFKAAIANGTIALIVAHNHPSGDPTPSRQDLDLTSRLKSVGELIGIPVVDHVIISNDGCVSLADRGYLGGYTKDEKA